MNAKVGVAIIIGLVIFLGLFCFYYVDSYKKTIEYKEVTDVLRNATKTGDKLSVLMGEGTCCEQTYTFSVSSSDSIDDAMNVLNLYKGELVTILYKHNKATEVSTLLHIKQVPLESRWE